MEKQELEQIVDDYQRLFYKVLRRCGIFPGQNDFEDHLQELRILFFLRAEKYPSRGLFEAENNVSYLFRHLLWHIVDQKRKTSPEEKEIQDEELLLLQGVEERFDEVETLAQFDRFYQQLKPKDQRKVVALLTDAGLSRQNRSRYRKYFQTKCKLFLKKW